MDITPEEAIDEDDLKRMTPNTDLEENKSERLRKLINELVSIKDPYASAIRTVHDGTKLREEIRKLALDGVKLPEDSDVYVGMRKCNGRVSWKDIAHSLAEGHKLESELQTLVDQYERKPMYRIVCGNINDDNYERAQQLDLFIDGKVKQVK